MIAAFRSYEAALRERVPGAIEEARRLAENVVDPLTSDANLCWPAIWDKPLFAYTKVEIGKAKRAALAPLMPGAWRTIGLPGSDYAVARAGAGRKADSFEITGTLAIRFRDEFRVAGHRMLAIQGAAAALRPRVKRCGKAPYADVAAMPMAEWVRTIQRENGPFWGRITALHLLTDLGLGCKPDLHLVRSARALGLAPDLRAGRVPTFSQAIALNEAIWNLAVALHGKPTPRDLRYIDKVLMEISFHGLLPQAFYSPADGPSVCGGAARFSRRRRTERAGTPARA